VDLYFIRHADSPTLADAGVASDFDRPLSELGRAECQALASALNKVGVRFEAIVTSPMVRAVQTSEELLAHLPEPLLPLHVFDEIGEDCRPRKVVKFLRELDKESVAIVGHRPSIDQLMAWLIGSKKAQLELAKAGVAKITGDDLGKGEGMLVWMTSPEWYGK